jgi:hypothetical protein
LGGEEVGMKNILKYILTLGILFIVFGFFYTAGSSIPFQDAPKELLWKQYFEIKFGEGFMFLGLIFVVVFFHKTIVNFLRKKGYNLLPALVLVLSIISLSMMTYSMLISFAPNYTEEGNGLMPIGQLLLTILITILFVIAGIFDLVKDNKNQ